MTVGQHAAAGLLLGAGMLAVTGSPWQAGIAALASVLIDFDHVIDFVLEQRQVRRLGAMMDHYRETRFKRVFLIFHSLEFIVLAAIVAWSLQLSLVLAATIGLGFHVLCDLYYWAFWKKRARAATYFFLFRARHGFRKSSLLLENSAAA